MSGVSEIRLVHLKLAIRRKIEEVVKKKNIYLKEYIGSSEPVIVSNFDHA